MPPEISAIIAALGGHANGSGWIARCPAHDDGTPSLSVSVANGKTLVHCQAGCSQQDVIAELRKQGLWQKKQDTLGPIVATYEYRRPNGELAYQVCKYLEPEKTFRQRQPDGAGWTWRTKGMDPIPYRLPELLAANSSSPVFIAEGEKDCDNIAKLGLTATCNHMGAKNWKRKISHWLRGYDVVLLPDNDRTGREHVEDVAEKLRGVAKRIRVLALPGLPEKGDVSDWIGAGGTAEQLLQMAEEAPDWTLGGAAPASATPEAVPDDFKHNDGGGIVANSQHNIRLAIRKLGIRLSHDIFADQLLIEGLEGSARRPLGDAEMDRLYLLVDESFHFRATKDFFWLVATDAGRRGGFHPVLDYLDNLTWDGAPRIGTWLTTYARAENTAYCCAIGRLILLAAVRRIRQPGCKFDEMPVFESGQGLNKSTALRTLAVKDEWFSDDLPLNCDSKEVIERLHGRWIVEAAELRGMRKGEIEHVKSFLSRIVDRARPAMDACP